MPKPKIQTIFLTIFVTHKTQKLRFGHIIWIVDTKTKFYFYFSNLFYFQVFHQSNPSDGLSPFFLSRNSSRLFSSLSIEESFDRKSRLDGDQQDERLPLASDRRPGVSLRKLNIPWLEVSHYKDAWSG